MSELLANYRLLSTNWQLLVEAGTRRAESEYYDTTSIDPRTILQKAREPQASEPSPLGVLEDIETFLVTMQQNPATPASRLPLLRSTLQMIRSAISEIETPDQEERLRSNSRPQEPQPTPSASPEPDPAPVNPDQPFLDRVRNLYDTFHLKDGPQFFIERIGTFVLWDITDRLHRGELSQEVADILRYLGGDIRARLLAPGNDSVQAISDDLSAARQITEGNIDVFREFFKNSIALSIQDRAARSKPPLENAVGANRPNGQMLGKLCTLMLVSGKDDSAWPKEIPWELCSGASYYYPGDPAQAPKIEVAKLRQELRSSGNQTRNYRMCGYHRYLRQTRLREILADLKHEPAKAGRSVREMAPMSKLPFSLSEGFFSLIQAPGLD